MSDVGVSSPAACLQDLKNEEEPTYRLLRAYARGDRRPVLMRALLYRSLHGDLAEGRPTVLGFKNFKNFKNVRSTLSADFESLSEDEGSSPPSSSFDYSSQHERRDRLKRLLKELCRQRDEEPRYTATADEAAAADEGGDVVVVRGESGAVVTPDASPVSGSWNSFEQFAALPTVAVRRPRPDVLVKKILTGEIEQYALEQRLREEIDNWALLAAADVAPTIYGVRIFTHKLQDESSVELITAVPQKYSLSLDSFLKNKGGGKRKEADVRAACGRVVELCFRAADVGFCHLDIKFGNIVLDEHPLEVRLIDFDPQYMRDVAQDAPLVQRLLSLLSLLPLPLPKACDVLRLFYVLLMLSFMALMSKRRQDRAQRSAEPDLDVVENFRVARVTFMATLMELGGPFSLFFIDPDLARSELMTLATNRMYQYDLNLARKVADADKPTTAARKKLQRAATEMASGGGKYAKATVRLQYADAKKHRDAVRRDALMAHLFRTLKEQTDRALSPSESLTVHGAAFKETSSSPGQHRKFQSLAYSQVCNTPHLQDVRTLSKAAERPVALKKTISLEQHEKLREEANARRRRSLLRPVKDAETGQGGPGLARTKTAVRNKHGEQPGPARL